MTDRSGEDRAGCLCGAVRYGLHGAPDGSTPCQCRSCRKATGAAFIAWAGVKKENLEVTEGRLIDGNASPGVERSFCGPCGISPTYVAEERWSGQIYVLAPTLGDPSIAAPRAHVHVELQRAWVRLDNGKLPAREGRTP